MTTIAKRPSKPWRVCWKGPNSADYRSQNAAYDAVASITRIPGLGADVHHWENGSWRLYERIAPTPNRNEQCPACTAELLHPEPICQDCGAATDGPDARRAAVPGSPHRGLRPHSAAAPPSPGVPHPSAPPPQPTPH